MIKYHPLQANTSAGATLFIDTEAGASDLLETAAHRIRAARDLLNSVSCLCLKNAEGYVTWSTSPTPLICCCRTVAVRWKCWGGASVGVISKLHLLAIRLHLRRIFLFSR
ncbi:MULTISPECIES: hypothetical protein [unclassified Pseudomonas]|uniref:hypothetical protein n=1 Tax=unclassified Pseudomonas TaxID=196821 RepID=UPI0029589C3E|nr:MULTISPECIES: hypothetical protein [unclassified Pseudomonas]